MFVLLDNICASNRKSRHPLRPPPAVFDPLICDRAERKTVIFHVVNRELKRGKITTVKITRSFGKCLCYQWSYCTSSIVMGKRRSKVEKMKLSSKKSAAGATLLNMEESDSDVQEFVLPKRKIIKPGRSARYTFISCEILIFKNTVFFADFPF